MGASWRSRGSTLPLQAFVLSEFVLGDVFAQGSGELLMLPSGSPEPQDLSGKTLLQSTL